MAATPKNPGTSFKSDEEDAQSAEFKWNHQLHQHLKYQKKEMIHGYSRQEDIDMDESYTMSGCCEDCGDPDTGYCFCTVPYSGVRLSDYKTETIKQNAARYRRHQVRKVRCVVICIMTVVYWRKQAALPHSKAFTQAAKRFKQLAESPANM